MKKTLLTLAAATLASSLSAQTFSTNFFPEGTFSPTPTTNIAFAGPQTITFPTTGGNPDNYGRIDSSNGGAWGVITLGETPPGITLSQMGLVPGVTYQFLWDMKTEADTNGVFSPFTGGMKIEWWDQPKSAGINPISTTGDMSFTPISTNGTWATYSTNLTVPANATHIIAVPLVTGASGLGAIIGFDNLRVVVPDSVPLNTQITLPADGAQVSTNGFWITATASVVPGNVTNIDFYADANPLGSATTTPYNLLVTGLTPGPAALTAVAKDDLGGSVTSSVVNVTVVTNIVQTLLTVDPDAAWGGFMNVYELSENFGGFVFGSQWGIPDLVAGFSGVGTNSILTLKPAFINVAPCTDTNVPPDCANGFTKDRFWYVYDAGYPENTNGAVGFKSMEANLLVTLSGENDNLVRFKGTNISASLLDPSSTNANTWPDGENSWTCEAYIKDLDSDFSTNSGLASEIVVSLTNGQPFDISLQTYPDPSRKIQYGFRTRGPNVWPGDQDAYGTVVIQTTPNQPPVNVTVDSSKTWVGFANFSETPANGGGFVFGQPWGFDALQAEFTCPDGLVLSSILVDDPSTFWYVGGGGPGAVGNKIAEAVAHVADDSLSGKTIIFSGTVVSASLLDPSNTNAAGNGWTGVAMIRDFAPDYSSFNEVSTPLTPGPFSIQLATENAPGRHIQYGFIVRGPTVWSTDSASFGNVVIENVGILPPALTATLNGGNIDLSFCTQDGFTYTVEYKDDLNAASWTALPGGSVMGSGGTEVVSDSTGNPDRYYRLVVQ